MFKQLTIENFQRHKLLVVDFDKAITTIRGTTDSGKSSIVRALRWVCLNQPRGEEFIRYGSKEVSVRLETDTHIVIRKRGKKNCYILGEPGIPEEDWKTFVSFGTGVPDEIKRTLSITETNFQGQHDSPFWFCESAADVSKQLNQIIDLSIIDTTLTNLNALVRKSKSTVAVTETRMIDARDERNRLKYVRKMQESLISLESLEQGIAENAHTRSLIDDLLSGYTRLSQKRERASEALRSAKRIVRDGDSFYDNKTKRDGLWLLSDAIRQSKEKIDGRIPPIKKLKKQSDKLLMMDDKSSELFDLIEKVLSRRNRLENTSTQFTVQNDRFTKLKKGRCPLCGQKQQS